MAPHVPFGTSFTIAAWVHADSQGNNDRLVGQGDHFNLYFSSSNKVAFGMLDGWQPNSNGVRVIDAGTHPDYTWTLYVGVVEAGVGNSTLRLYKDGVEVASQSFAQTFTNPGTCRFYMGHMPGASSCTDTQVDEFARVDAMLDDVRVYGRALSAGEVGLLFVEPDTHGVVP